MDPEKVEAIDKIKAPTNITELQRLLGMTVFLALCKYSSLTEPFQN